MAFLKKTTPAAKPTPKVAAKTAPKVAKPATDEADAGSEKKSGRKAPPVGKGRAPNPIKPTWQAPSDFKPSFYSFRFKTDRWGLIDTRSVFGERIRGRWDNPDAKRWDLSEFDPATLRGFAMIMSAAIYAPNPGKRLPPNQPFLCIVRAGKASETNILRARLVAVGTKTKADAKLRWFEDKTDPAYRRLRRVNRSLPSAFVDAQLPPLARKKSSADEESEQ